MDLLWIEDLERWYGRLRAFHCDSLRMPAGVIGLLGPNGAGKSTLLQMLLGLLRPSAGRARVLDLDVRRRSSEIRARVGYMPENDSFVAGLSAHALVALAGELCGMRRTKALRRAHEVLSFLGVEASRYSAVAEPSTGMKQRVKLAQALVHDPELLILDEPTNGLDPAGRAAMLELIANLHREQGKSVILSSHLLQDVDRICDAVIILDGGEVLAHGRIDELRSRSARRHVLRVEGDPSRFVNRLRHGGYEVVVRDENGDAARELLVDLPDGARPLDVLRVLDGVDHETGEETSDAGCVFRGLAPDEESLEDLFERVVGGEVRPGGVFHISEEDLVDG